MVRVFLLVCWLASEALPMLKIDTLARLISLFQFRDAANYVLNVGKNYVNHMAAKDMTMSMAAVLREWINVRARLSPVLGIVSVLCRRYLQGFIRGRKVVQLFKHPDGWCEGMFTRRCIRKEQPSDSIKYDDGFNQPCERSTYGTALGKKWCIIQPIS